MIEWLRNRFGRPMTLKEVFKKHHRSNSSPFELATQYRKVAKIRRAEWGEQLSAADAELCADLIDLCAELESKFIIPKGPMGLVDCPLCHQIV